MLELLSAQAKACTACGLARGRTHVVFGEGNPEANLMIVGEGPGEEEDLQGRPFVGRSGQLLDKILEAAGISRASVYIANIVKCRPPGNRAPDMTESKTCSSLWLIKQIDLVKPQIIIPLGATALEFFAGEKLPITKVRGKEFSWNNTLIFPMFHPAYLLRNPSREAGSPKYLTWQDIQSVKKRLDELGPKLPSSTISQGSLF
jgi:uracil-DNA glycosylase